jgi:ribosomal protein S18 acetylase RimI-like enzyme
MPETGIRPYASADRAAVFRIAADTAFFGAPVETLLEDRNLFCDIFYRYYTDLEPERAWVAYADDQVVGFLMGCVNTTVQRRLWARKILPVAIWRILRGKYRLGARTQRYAWGMTRGALYGEFLHVNMRQYPAHLHVNMATAWRGHGLGRRLIEAYLSQLRQLRVPGVYLDTTDMNTAACRLYEKMGFQVVEARPTRQWEQLVPRPVINLCYAMELGSGSTIG